MCACFSLGSGGCAAMGDCNPIVSECEAFASCEVEDYATPAVEIASAAQAASALTESLGAATPRGLTPTRPALQGALAHAAVHSTQDPAHRVIIVLVTDGPPTGCLERDDTTASSAAAGVAAVAAVAAGGLAGSPPIETHVIGLTSPTEPDVTEQLEAIARAGGGTAQLVDIEGDLATGLHDALQAIRGDALVRPPHCEP